jgi:hypothetical protein
MALKINNTTAVTDDRVVVLGNFPSFESLPASAARGTVAYVTSDEQLYYKKTAGWQPITAKLGSVYRPANDAAEILAAGDSTGDGVYYIKSSSGTIQTYCDMTNGGYMLVAIIQAGDSGWYYSGGYWGYTSTVNESLTTSLGSTTAINRLYYEYTLKTGFRMCLGTGRTNNGLLENYSGNTARTAFNTFRPSSSQSRSSILSWMNNGTGNAISAFDNQPNCNVCGFLLDYTYARARWGITMNNENDCGSNDSAAGFGCYGASGGSQASAGGATWNPSQNFNSTGYIFVK